MSTLQGIQREILAAHREELTALKADRDEWILRLATLEERVRGEKEVSRKQHSAALSSATREAAAAAEEAASSAGELR